MARILIVAMAASIHTARWIRQISGQGWDIHLFPSIDTGVSHSDLDDITVYHSFYSAGKNSANVRVRGIPLLERNLAYTARKALPVLFKGYQAKRLARLIRKLKPDVVHAMEIQHAGYLVAEAIKIIEVKTPPLIVTNWGSDIYLYGRLSAHEARVKGILSLADYYSCECQRDVCLAKEYGFNGTVLPVFPNTGGFNLQKCAKLRSKGKTSARRKIMLKGYQNFAGRALVGLRALERCEDLLGGYEIVLYSVSEDVMIAAELFSQNTGVPTVVIPKDSPQADILKMHGEARISIGLSISDAISTSLLEAIVMGAFPIQSWTACAYEWVDDGVNGFLVPPEDPDIVELKIREALLSDSLVDNAEKINSDVAEKRLKDEDLKAKAIELYENVIPEIEVKFDGNK